MASSPENYTLGKGIVYFNRRDLTTGLYTGERDLGNAPAFSFNVALEKMEHFSSRGGLKAKDKSIISQITPACAFTLDEITAENLSMLTLGDIETVTQVATPVVDELVIAHLDRRVQLTKRDVSSVVVKDAATGLITYVAGTDYIIDTSVKDDKIGRIYFPEDGAITEDQELEVSYTPAAITYKKIAAFKQTQVEGFLRFVSDNPAGTQQELQIWRVSLSPTGDTAMIGDGWSTIGFAGEILKDSANHPDSPYFDILL